MKRNITIIAGGIILITLLAKIGFFDALLLFLLVGAIPGTNFSIPSSVMFFLSATIGVFVLAKLATRQATYIRVIARLKARYETYRSRLPKRRYSEI